MLVDALNRFVFPQTLTFPVTLTSMGISIEIRFGLPVITRVPEIFVSLGILIDVRFGFDKIVTVPEVKRLGKLIDWRLTFREISIYPKLEDVVSRLVKFICKIEVDEMLKRPPTDISAGNDS